MFLCCILTLLLVINSSKGNYNTCDDVLFCAGWKRLGLCASKEMKMTLLCPKTCQLCGDNPGRCRDINICNYYKGAGYCTKSAKAMNMYCKRTCDFCTNIPPPVNISNIVHIVYRGPKRLRHLSTGATSNTFSSQAHQAKGKTLHDQEERHAKKITFVIESPYNKSEMSASTGQDNLTMPHSVQLHIAHDRHKAEDDVSVFEKDKIGPALQIVHVPDLKIRIPGVFIYNNMINKQGSNQHINKQQQINKQKLREDRKKILSNDIQSVFNKPLPAREDDILQKLTQADVVGGKVYLPAILQVNLPNIASLKTHPERPVPLLPGKTRGQIGKTHENSSKMKAQEENTNILRTQRNKKAFHDKSKTSDKIGIPLKILPVKKAKSQLNDKITAAAQPKAMRAGKPLFMTSKNNTSTHTQTVQQDQTAVKVIVEIKPKGQKNADLVVDTYSGNTTKHWDPKQMKIPKFNTSRSRDYRIKLPHGKTMRIKTHVTESGSNEIDIDANLRHKIFKPLTLKSN